MILYCRNRWFSLRVEGGDAIALINLPATAVLRENLQFCKLTGIKDLTVNEDFAMSTWSGIFSGNGVMPGFELTFHWEKDVPEPQTFPSLIEAQDDRALILTPIKKSEAETLLEFGGYDIFIASSSTGNVDDRTVSAYVTFRGRDAVMIEDCKLGYTRPDSNRE